MSADYDEIDRLIDTDPIALGVRCRVAVARAERAETEVARLRTELAIIAAVWCGIPGHTVAVGCGCPQRARAALEPSQEGDIPR